MLSKIMNNRLHDELREKMGLGYSASFGSVLLRVQGSGLGFRSEDGPGLLRFLGLGIAEFLDISFCLDIKSDQAVFASSSVS